MSTQIFDDAGVDAIKGSEIMGLLDLTPEDFGIPKRFSQFRDVVDFMKGFSDYRYVLNKITRGKQVDKLDHAWSYTALAKEKNNKLAQLSDLESKMSEINRFGDESTKEKLNGISDMYLQMKKDLVYLDEEMSIYEK